MADAGEDAHHHEENSLRLAASAYLRSARHQPIDWQQWGEAAFARAREENKPVLLDIGAVWCHWCHVMDRESYENAETAALINEHFIAVKVDRDERPDVDSRYQAAVAAISGQGGWPLTAFLTPDGNPFFGGTYFPPDERYGRPSFRRVLLTMAEAFQSKPDEVAETAASVLAAVSHNESFDGRSGDHKSGLEGAGLLAKLLQSATRQFDSTNGGFGSQPKFPHSGAIDLLLDAAARPAADARLAEQCSTVATVTLRKMADGGIRDQLAGGFHRYSVDERWVVPHFEKMAYDNSELLKNYVHAFQSYVDPEFARIAHETLHWMDEVLSDRERGGFFASQDADDSLDDDGDYFTWTLDEARAVLTAEELQIAAPFYDIGEIGDMHHNSAKNVLHITRPLADIAKQQGIEASVASERIEAAQEKLLEARLARKTPFVDRTLYTGWNGMCISAYLAAGRALKLPEARAFALKSLDRVLAAAWNGKDLNHVVAYGDADAVAPSQPVRAVLEDFAFLGEACIDAFEATGELRYFTTAEELAGTMLDNFYDETGDGFFDTQAAVDGVKPIGAMSTRRKPLQDAPTPAGNSVAADLLLRLAAFNNNEDYRARAVRTLEAFAGIVEHFGLYAASYGLALRRYVESPLQVCVVGDDALADDLETTALARYAVNKSVLRFTREQLSALPPALAETLPALANHAGSFAMVCSGNTCHPPVSEADALIDILAAAV